MKKLINNTNDIVNEMIDGIVQSFPTYLQKVNNLPIIIRKNKKIDKVALISGGGSGHEPAHAGFVGTGMLDAAICGEIFTSPGPDKVYEAIKAVETTKGVLLIVKNYNGDVMNFDMAMEMAQNENINVKKIVVNDDIAVENSTYSIVRRGIAGTVFVHKIVGAAAEKGYSLEQLEQLGNKVIERTKTLGMSLYPCFVPTSNKFSFELKEDEVEIGIGIHGEPGTHREKLKSANEHVEFILDKLISELNNKDNENVAVMINGLGSTTLMELFIISNHVQRILKDKKINVVDTNVGNYMTSLDMSGFSITLVKMDNEMKELLMDKADTIAFKRI